MSWSFFLPNFIAACESTSSIIPEWGPFQVAIEWQLSGKHCSRSEVKVDVVSDSLWPHGLYSPRNSPGQNTGVGSLSLLQRIFPTQRSNPGLQRSSFILLSYILGLKSNLFTGCGMSNNLCTLSQNVILLMKKNNSAMANECWYLLGAGRGQGCWPFILSLSWPPHPYEESSFLTSSPPASHIWKWKVKDFAQRNSRALTHDHQKVRSGLSEISGVGLGVSWKSLRNSSCFP